MSLPGPPAHGPDDGPRQDHEDAGREVTAVEEDLSGREPEPRFGGPREEDVERLCAEKLGKVG